jgi:6-phosphogluconolactonase
MSSTLNAFRLNPNDGSLISYARLSTIPENFEGYNSTADIHVNKSGDVLYISNRGLNSIAIFDLNSENGDIKFRKNVPSGGEFPRNFMLEPQGKYAFIANRNSDNVVLFEITTNGDLVETNTKVSVPSAVCVKYLALKQ